MTKIHNKSTVTTEPSLYYKMYKAGKLWMYAGIMGAAVTGTTLINNGTAHADTTTGDTTSASSSSDTYTKIATPDSTVTNAASAATNAGATVTSTAGTTYNVSGASELAKAQSAVAQDYASQSQDLANATTQAQNSSSAATEVASTNEQIESAASALKATGATATQGDTKTITSVDQVSQMKTDAQTQINQMNSMASKITAVSNATAEANATVKSAADVANAVPGLTVTASGKTVTVSSVSQAQQLANQQKGTIETAAKEQEDKNKTKNVSSNTISSQQVSQQLILGNEANATTQITYLADGIAAYVAGNDNYGVINGSYGHRKLVGDITTADQAGYGYVFVDNASNPLANPINGEIAQVTYTNLSNSYYGDTKISKIVVTYSNATPTGNMYELPSENGGQGYFLSVSQNPVSGNMRSVDIQSTYQYYDENGNIIDFGKDGGAWLSVGSLNFDQGKNTSTGDESGTDANQGISEAVSVVSGGEGHALYNSSIQNHDGTYYANFNNYASNFDPSSPYYGWDSTGSKLQYYGAMVVKLTGTSVTLQEKLQAWGGASISDAQYQNKYLRDSWFTVSTDIPKTPTNTITYDKYEYKPGASFTYNLYNSRITPPSATYHLDSIYYGQGTDTKKVSDTQHGKITDVNGQQLTTGDQVTYKITADSLPAGRENDISNLTFSDTLPDGMSVNDAKMVDANGNDVSGNFTKSINGNAVSFTTTSDYLKVLNADKSSVAKLPVMEIVATVTKDSATLKNQAIVLVNNNSVTTNTTVNTSGTSTPTKSETANGGSQDANEMTLQRGDTINYKVDLDYKNIKANTAISDAQKAKGLSFSDTYDSKTTAKPETAKLVTADGTELPSGMYTLTWDTANHTVTGKITDVDSFIKAYGGQVLSLKFDAVINEDVKDSEKVYNTAYQTNFGQTYQTNTVWNKVDVPSPTKSETVDDNMVPCQ